jgi:hypothetical protein
MAVLASPPHVRTRFDDGNDFLPASGCTYWSTHRGMRLDPPSSLDYGLLRVNLLGI